MGPAEADSGYQADDEDREDDDERGASAGADRLAPQNLVVSLGDADDHEIQHVQEGAGDEQVAGAKVVKDLASEDAAGKYEEDC